MCHEISKDEDHKVDGIVIQAGKGGKPRIDDLPQTTARLTGV
jgi:hypothetical protein